MNRLVRYSPHCLVSFFLTRSNVSNTYQPDGFVTRAHMALFLYRAFKIADAQTSIDSFADVPSSHYAHTAVEALYAANITSGCSDNPPRYCPTLNVTRAQMAAFLSRAITHSSYDTR